MNIAVTGASGFIGRHLCRKLGREHYLCGIGRSESEVEGCEEFVAIDLEQAAEEGEFPATRISHGIDTVIHLAARLSGPGDEMNMEVFYANVRMARAVAEMCRELNARHLLHFSTMAVYPNESGEYDEESRIWPAANTEGLYGLSKFAAENILSHFTGEQTCVTHLRVAQVHGEGMRDDRVIPVMLRELREHNRITVFGNGERVSNFIRVEHLADIAERFLDKPAPGLFNVGEKHLSYEELARNLIKKYGNEKSEIRYREKGSRSRFRLNTDKLRNYLGSNLADG